MVPLIVNFATLGSNLLQSKVILKNVNAKKDRRNESGHATRKNTNRTVCHSVPFFITCAHLQHDGKT